MGPVLVDHRERSSAIPKALVAAGLDVRLTDLPVGDYVLGPGLAVERKGPADLGASIRDGRIFDQAVRLQSAFPQAVLLIEGEPRWIAEDAWRGAVCRLVEDGFAVLHSLDAADSAAWIVRLAKRARRAVPTVRTEGPARRRDTRPHRPGACSPSYRASAQVWPAACSRSTAASPRSPQLRLTVSVVNAALAGCEQRDSPKRCTAHTSHPWTANQNPRGLLSRGGRRGAGSSPA